MCKVLVLSLAVLCCGVGIASLLGEVWLWLCRPRRKARRVLLVLEDGTDEQRLYMEQCLRWYGSRLADGVVFVSEAEHSDLTDRGIIQICRKGDLAARLAAWNDHGRIDGTS